MSRLKKVAVTSFLNRAFANCSNSYDTHVLYFYIYSTLNTFNLPGVRAICAKHMKHIYFNGSDVNPSIHWVALLCQPRRLPRGWAASNQTDHPLAVGGRLRALACSDNGETRDDGMSGKPRRTSALSSLTGLDVNATISSVSIIHLIPL
jgi:hypothetical protein